jgi:hypothetical protein
MIKMDGNFKNARKLLCGLKKRFFWSYFVFIVSVLQKNVLLLSYLKNWVKTHDFIKTYRFLNVSFPNETALLLTAPTRDPSFFPKRGLWLKINY